MNVDKLITIASVIAASILLIFGAVNAYTKTEGSVTDKVFSVIDSSSSFTKEDRETIEKIYKSGTDKDVISKIAEYIEKDDEQGLEDYLEEVLR